MKDGPSCLSSDKSLTLTDILQDETELEHFKVHMNKQTGCINKTAITVQDSKTSPILYAHKNKIALRFSHSQA